MTEDEFRELFTVRVVADKEKRVNKEKAIEKAHYTTDLYEQITGNKEDADIVLQVAMQVINEVYAEKEQAH